MSIIDYTATGANCLKNWELMTKPALETLTYDDNENFWPFHETFLNHIENMGWQDIMTYTINNVATDLSTNFGEVPIADIEQFRAATVALPANDAAANSRRLKFKGMYTYLFNSIDKDFKRHLTLSVDTHHRMGPLAWKMITDHSVKNDNQTIRRALCNTHTITLADFDHNVDKLITHVQQNLRILTSSGETDRSIAANLFRILKVAPCAEFCSWVVQKQTAWDEGAAFDLNNFMKNAKAKYNHYTQDKLWLKTKTMTDIKKETDIVALTSKIDRLEALLAQSAASTSTSAPTSQNSTSSNTSNSRSGWKITAPNKGEPWSKTVNGKLFNWCKYHRFWTTQHTSNNCRKGEKERTQTTTASAPSLELNVASLGTNLYPDLTMNLAYNSTIDPQLSDDFDVALDHACIDDNESLSVSQIN